MNYIKYIEYSNWEKTTNGKHIIKSWTKSKWRKVMINKIVVDLTPNNINSSEN